MNMRSWIRTGAGFVGAALLAVGCSPTNATTDPFVAFTDQFGRNTAQDNSSGGGGTSGVNQSIKFRQLLTLTLNNNDPNYALQLRLAAWVLPSAFTNADQQDELLRFGFVQLTAPVQIGSAYTLPVGTFVYAGTSIATGANSSDLVFNGGGQAGAMEITIGQGTATGTTLTPHSISLQLPTPDVLLVFMAPPTSCDSPAFVFVDEGTTADISHFGGGYSAYPTPNRDGPIKTLQQVDVYECDPLKPGLFFRKGGVRNTNQFSEGDTVQFDFYRVPLQGTQNEAVVTIGG